MNYNLVKFEEKLNLINNLIFNLTKRNNNINYINLLGEHCKTINNYKINDDYDIFIDITRKFIITFDHFRKRIIVVGLVEEFNVEESNFISYFVYNYITTECSLCNHKTLNIVEFLYKNYYKYYNSQNDYLNFSFMYPMLDTDTFLDNLIKDLSNCLK